MPSYSATADFGWHLRFFTGLSDAGVPQFSNVEAEAQPLVMNQVGEPSPDEPWSLVNMISVRWLPALQQWVMLYGGGSTLSPPPVGAVLHENNPIFVRFSDQPFGPWSEPQILFNAGDPQKGASELAATAYGPSGILFHAECEGSACAPAEAFFQTGVPPFTGKPYGFLYGPNIIQEWTTQREPPQSGVDIYWTISTYDPYQVVLMRSHIAPHAGLSQ
jgi:hypothetical protein